MLKISKINLHYEEFAVRQNSSPGWELVAAFVTSILEAKLPFQSWILLWNLKAGYYTESQRFDNENKSVFLSSLNNAIRKDAVCLIKTHRGAHFEHLFQDYAKVSEGTIADNGKSAVFPAPIELNDWPIIDEGELVLVIHHDGDPLFILEQ